jgi:hypothetical protein
MPKHACSIVHDLGPETPWVECRIAGDRGSYRVRISHVRTFDPTTDEDVPGIGAAPFEEARI